MRTELLRFNGAVERAPAIDAWMRDHAGELGAIAHHWFGVMRKCGDEVRELLHDSCPVACLGDAPFGYVNVFTSHVNVGFFHGAALPDPARLLQGTDKFMRHVKLRPETPTNAAALTRFTQGRLFGASWFAFAAACQVARPLCRSDQNSSGHRDFYLQASDESVTLLAAGYNYDSHWTVLSQGLSPFGMTTSVAAP